MGVRGDAVAAAAAVVVAAVAVVVVAVAVCPAAAQSCVAAVDALGAGDGVSVSAMAGLEAVAPARGGGSVAL